MKIAILSSHTTSLFWFRIDFMKKLVELGHSVVAVGSEPEDDWTGKFNRFKIRYRFIPVVRTGINPYTDIKTLVELYRLLKHETPDVIFAYHPKTVIFGSIAARLNGITEIYPLFSGLGSIFRDRGVKNHILKIVMKINYWIACTAAKKVMFQNPDDQNIFIKSRLVSKEKCVIINGSGVNIDHFQEVGFPEKTGFLYIGRLLRDKGVIEYLEACRKIKKHHPEIRCMLVGPFDSNPTSLNYNDLQPYIEEGSIEYFGAQTDVRPFIQQCSVYVLPSYHEGTPKSVLEAMAMGRPVITTNTVGCKETVEEGKNGFLVDVHSSSAVAEKMEWFISNSYAIKAMGKESVRICHQKYDVRIVNNQILSCMNLKPEFIENKNNKNVSTKSFAGNGQSRQGRRGINDYEYIQENQQEENSI